MKLASWNVNGIRAAEKKGFFDWIEKNQWDIVALQETKISLDQLDQINPSEFVRKNYIPYFFSAEKRGYSGVAFLVKRSLQAKITPGLGIKKFDSEGRTLTAEFGDYVLINGYYPNGQRDHNRVPYKLEFSREMIKLANAHQERGKKVILCGDFNTAHEEIDLANPKTNRNTTGFLFNEREFLTEIIELGYRDIFRYQTPKENGHYTWWTYRNNCREKNVGWRIDYFFVSKNMHQDKMHAGIQSDVLGSDHCPIILKLN